MNITFYGLFALCIFMVCSMYTQPLYSKDYSLFVAYAHAILSQSDILIESFKGSESLHTLSYTNDWLVITYYTFYLNLNSFMYCAATVIYQQDLCPNQYLSLAKIFMNKKCEIIHSS